MPCKKCENEKWKWGENGECQYDSKEACEEANKDKKGYKSVKKEYSYVSPLGKKTHTEYVEECVNLKLAKQKIELNIQDDVTDALDRVLEEQQKLNNAVKEMRQVMKTINYGFFQEMEAVLGDDDEIFTAVKELDNALNNMDTKAGELGLDPMDFSPDYKRAIDIKDQIERESGEWYGAYKQAEALMKALR